MLYIVLAYLMLFAALTNSVCLNNASFFFLFKYFLCQGYELSGEIALKNNHYYYYYYYLIWLIVHTMSLYLIIVLLLLLYTQVFLRVQFLALFLSPCILSHCLPILTHTLSYIIHLLMSYNYRCLLPQIEYLSYFTQYSHV